MTGFELGGDSASQCHYTRSCLISHFFAISYSAQF